MVRPTKAGEQLPPIWRVSDELRTLIAQILVEHDAPRHGPQRIARRAARDPAG
jgi:hypothetical protein